MKNKFNLPVFTEKDIRYSFNYIKDYQTTINPMKAYQRFINRKKFAFQLVKYR
jgi:hypothetical protein